jgi:hypothetical protein
MVEMLESEEGATIERMVIATGCDRIDSRRAKQDAATRLRLSIFASPLAQE